VAFTMLGGVTTPSRQDDLLLIGALRDLQRDVLLAQNERLSNVLAADFWNPSHHESAALLLSAFALREASGTFLDLRRTLCRLTAHLALADALRGAHDRTLQGRLAEAALLSLVGRQQDAVARLNATTSAELPEEARAWLRALRLRATLDWRLL